MPLDPVYVDISIAGGIDAKSDRKIVRSPATLRADNVQYSTAGSVRKRYGISFLPQPPGQNVQTLASTSNELLSTDASFFYAYSPKSGVWSKRGICPQCAIGTTTVGNYQLPTSFSGSSGTVRSLTYDVIGGIGLAAWDTGDLYDPTYGNSRLNKIILVLFDLGTGKTLWKQTISSPFYSTSMNFSFDTQLLANGLTQAQTYGVGYPIVRAFNGQFYLSFVGALFTTDYRVESYVFGGYMYYLQTFRLGTPAALALNIPTITSVAYTNCTRVTNGTSGETIPAAFYSTPGGVSSSVTCPLYFDMQTNGSDLVVAVSKQNTIASTANKPISFIPTPERVQYGLVSGDSLTTYARTAEGTAGPIAVAASPRVNGALPATAVYAIARTNTIDFMRPPSCPSPGLLTVKTYDGATPSPNQPISVGVFQDGSNYVAYVTDGLVYQKLSVNPNTGVATTVYSDSLIVDYAMPFANYIGSKTGSVGSYLQSRIFLAPDGQPVVWVMVQLINPDTINALVLIPVGDAVVPRKSIYASCFYLRAGASLLARQPCNVVDSAILAFQLTDIPNRIAAIKRVRIDAQPYPSICKLNQGALITGGHTRYYDGQECRSLGWVKYPESPGMDQAYRSGSQLLVRGFAYSYVAVWADYDAYGNVIYSSPSPVLYLAKSFSGYVANTGLAADFTDNTGKVFYAHPRLPLIVGDILTPTRGEIIWYRNNSKDPLTYRRIPSLTYFPMVETVSLAQDQIPQYPAGQPGYYDLSPDDNSANPQLYSQPGGGELPNDPPPASSFAVTTIKRPFVASAENRSWLYFGKPYFPGRPPEFNALSFLDIDPPSGDITGLAVLDQNVIIFKAERIFILAGDGPDPTGAGAFNNTYAVATDTGCLESASIVSTEVGVYFRSVRGIQMIDRSLQVSYPGAQVERIVNASSITGAVIVPAQNQIRFALRSNDPTIAGTAADNVVLVLDYLQTKWSQYRFNPLAAGSARVAGQAMYQSNYFALAGNTVFQDAGPYNTDGVVRYTDGTAPVPMTIETGWIPLAGPQGWGRLRRVNVLGDFRDNHSLTLYFGWDYDEEYTYSIAYTPSGLTTGNAQNWRVRAPRQVGQAVRFKLVDNGTGEAIVITGLELETSQKSGATRVPDSKSV